jgi:hypothetical protein
MASVRKGETLLHVIADLSSSDFLRGDVEIGR